LGIIRDFTCVCEEKWILSRKTPRQKASKLIHVMQNELRFSVDDISVVK
jgi:hypothetical protein